MYQLSSRCFTSGGGSISPSFLKFSKVIEVKYSDKAEQFEFESIAHKVRGRGKDSLLALGALLFVTSVATAQVVASHSSTAAPHPVNTVTASNPAGKPLLRVNGTVLTDRDLAREISAMFPYAGQHNGGVPKSMEADIRQGAVKMMVFEELVYQEAKRQHMTVSPERIARGEADFRKQFSSTLEYQEFLQEEFHGDRKPLRAKIERSLLIDKFLTLEVSDKATVSAGEEEAYFNKHPEQFRIPESFSFQSISILPPQGANTAQLKEAQKRAQDALRQAKATKSYQEFGLLAEKISEDDFRVMLGNHKAADASKLPPAVVKAFRTMQPGQVSDVIEFAPNAYTILRLNTHTAAGTEKFDRVKQDLREQMTKQKAEQLRSALATKLSQNAKIEKL